MQKSINQTTRVVDNLAWLWGLSTSDSTSHWMLVLRSRPVMARIQTNNTHYRERERERCVRKRVWVRGDQSRGRVASLKLDRVKAPDEKWRGGLACRAYSRAAVVVCTSTPPITMSTVDRGGSCFPQTDLRQTTGNEHVVETGPGCGVYSPMRRGASVTRPGVNRSDNIDHYLVYHSLPRGISLGFFANVGQGKEFTRADRS